MKQQVFWCWMGLSLLMGSISFLACGALSKTTNVSTDSALGSIKGLASAAPIALGSVYLHALDDNGNQLSGGKMVSQTDANGYFQFNNIPIAPPFEILVTGGSYIEEATGETISLAGNIRLLVSDFNEAIPLMAVTPFTEIAATRVFGIGSGTLKEKIAQANHEVSFQSNINILSAPSLPSEIALDPNSNGARYALLLAALSQLASIQINHLTSIDMSYAFANNFKSNGTFAICLPPDANAIAASIQASNNKTLSPESHSLASQGNSYTASQEANFLKNGGTLPSGIGSLPAGLGSGSSSSIPTCAVLTGGTVVTNGGNNPNNPVYYLPSNAWKNGLSQAANDFIRRQPNNEAISSVVFPILQ